MRTQRSERSVFSTFPPQPAAFQPTSLCSSRSPTAKDVDEPALAALFAGHASFDFILDRVKRWDDGIVWLHPEPSQPFEDLTSAIWQTWPAYHRTRARPTRSFPTSR